MADLNLTYHEVVNDLLLLQWADGSENAILLKGGLIAVILHLLLLFTAIYYAFFRSNNYYVVGIGHMLLIYTLLLFIENFVNYTSNNLFIWFFIGVCLSKEIRNMTNLEIKMIFKTKKHILYWHSKLKKGIMTP